MSCFCPVLHSPNSTVRLKIEQYRSNIFTSDVILSPQLPGDLCKL